MKTMKTRILQKLQSIPQPRILHLNASDALPSSPPPLRNLCPSTPRKPDFIDNVSLMLDLDNYKENINPAPSPRPSYKKLKTGLYDGHFRRPELESETLFDPDLLAAFHNAVVEYFRGVEEARAAAKEKMLARYEDDPLPLQAMLPRIDNPLMGFEHRCPPGGNGAVVLYTTSLRGIRKTFEDCVSVRYLLESSKVLFDERDVSMHMEFREELWRVMEGRVIPPRLFIKGRYVGGADEVMGMHEQGRLMPLLQGMPRSEWAVCEDCGGMRFVVCFRCNGGRKVYEDEVAEEPVQCQHCNENGLVLCTNC